MRLLFPWRVHVSKARLSGIFTVVTLCHVPLGACDRPEGIQSGCECGEVQPDLYEGTSARVHASLR